MSISALGLCIIRLFEQGASLRATDISPDHGANPHIANLLLIQLLS